LEIEQEDYDVGCRSYLQQQGDERALFEVVKQVAFVGTT
jgi:hypothetical protein